MNKFEQYLTDNGIYIFTAIQYGKIVDKFLAWIKQQQKKARQAKREQVLTWLEDCRKAGNKKRTILGKENALKHYFNFLGVKINPACSFIPKEKKIRDVPLTAIKKAELFSFYQSLNPRTPCAKRDRCMLGLVLFQALTRSELTELMASDINFDNGTLSVPASRRTNERQLNLEPYQVQHLYEYVHRWRKDFVTFRGNDNGRLFLPYGSGALMNNAINRLLKNLRLKFPQIRDLRHIRGSVITHWQSDEGTIEAMVKSGHRYASSTKRYDIVPLNELQDQLKAMHPLETLKLDYQA